MSKVQRPRPTLTLSTHFCKWCNIMFKSWESCWKVCLTCISSSLSVCTNYCHPDLDLLINQGITVRVIAMCHINKTCYAFLCFFLFFFTTYFWWNSYMRPLRCESYLFSTCASPMSPVSEKYIYKPFRYFGIGDLLIVNFEYRYLFFSRSSPCGRVFTLVNGSNLLPF